VALDVIKSVERILSLMLTHILLTLTVVGKFRACVERPNSEEVRDILASLEIVYRELFPHLNLRQWSGFIYQWLTQSHFDPTHSGRVTMDQ
jgi:hypothetical protein